MADPVSFNEARAEKIGDSRLWTPLDLAKRLLQGIESGAIKPNKIVVHYLEPLENGDSIPGYFACGVTALEHVALLHVAMHYAIRDFSQ